MRERAADGRKTGGTDSNDFSVPFESQIKISPRFIYNVTDGRRRPFDVIEWHTKVRWNNNTRNSQIFLKLPTSNFKLRIVNIVLLGEQINDARSGG